MKKIIFTITNDISFDQRMHRICGSLAETGYNITLVGLKNKKSLPLIARKFNQKRIACFFKTGKLFYAEYNLRLFFYLLFKKSDCLCAIDLDTMLPVFFVSKLKGTKRVYDAHEYFTQLNEVICRPFIYKIWLWLEKKMVPRFKNGYTVCRSLATEFKKNFNADYEVIRNVPILNELPVTEKRKNILLYQGAVNQGRGLEKLVAAMQNIEAELWICGDGNFINDMKTAVTENNVNEKVTFLGMLDPLELKKKTAAATIAINPFERKGLNQYLSLSNKFFDYIHAALPQITMNYPEYQEVNKEQEIAVLIDDLEPGTISNAVNKLLSDTILFNRLKNNCLLARQNHNWQLEEKKLITFYNHLFHE
ncbi:MAG TPA: glycosyltransferase [Chitinophagaceae bacterium]|nr:glycosyltransferase [Chitinophagaceae bacterium]